MSRNGRPKTQPEPAYIDKDGKLRDDGLHDAMLGNPEANAAFRRMVIEDARKRGMSEADIERLYGGMTRRAVAASAP